MTDFATDFNIQSLNIEPYVFTDVVSSTNIYIGTSRSFNAGGAPNWRIKRVWQVGTVWYMGYPGGDQGFTFIWNNRATYTYK
jgi:hypothetical protein